MDKKERIKQIRARIQPNWHGHPLTEEQKADILDKEAERIFAREEKGDAITEQVNLILQNRQRKLSEQGLKHHTLKWAIENMKTVKDISKFYIQENYPSPKISWKHEISATKSIDLLRTIIAYWYVKLFYKS